MGNDPAFLFYPGDYLRDTQCFSEKVQVSYDRIMCEHMRNICISKKQLKFFTKRLSEEELEELMVSLTEYNGGYQIRWVAESIEKRRAYSKSRRENRRKKPNNICRTYDEHMENENEIEIENKDVYKNRQRNKKFDFESVWEKYPKGKKMGKEEALGYFNISVKTVNDYEDIKKALDNYCNKIKTEMVEKKYIKDGCNWFKDWRPWVDYTSEMKEKNAKQRWL